MGRMLTGLGWAGGLTRRGFYKDCGTGCGNGMGVCLDRICPK